MNYLRRDIEKQVKAYLKIFPVVGITGPRQSGKSTMLREIFGDKFRYVTFDEPAMVDLFSSDPERFFSIYDDKVIFDEIQRVPELFRYIKIKVDNDRQKYGRFILTGSAQFSLVKEISESLAGRIGLLSLLPLHFNEIPVASAAQSLWLGCYPEIVSRNYLGNFDWLKSYVDTYISRDIRSFVNVGDLREFLRFIRILASRTAQILNLSEISKEMGISVPTVKKWISILEASYIIFLLPPFYNNFGKRLIKSPKLYFYDTGIVSYLTGIRTKEQFEFGPMYGAIFENYIVSEVKKKLMHNAIHKELFYFRDSNGNEIDLIIDGEGAITHIEIKAGHTFKSEMLGTLDKLNQQATNSLLVYRGKKQFIDEKTGVLNFTDFLRSFPEVKFTR